MFILLSCPSFKIILIHPSQFTFSFQGSSNFMLLRSSRDFNTQLFLTHLSLRKPHLQSYILFSGCRSTVYKSCSLMVIPEHQSRTCGHIQQSAESSSSKSRHAGLRLTTAKPVHTLCFRAWYFGPSATSLGVEIDTFWFSFQHLNPPS